MEAVRFAYVKLVKYKRMPNCNHYVVVGSATYSAIENFIWICFYGCALAFAYINSATNLMNGLTGWTAGCTTL